MYRGIVSNRLSVNRALKVSRDSIEPSLYLSCFKRTAGDKRPDSTEMLYTTEMLYSTEMLDSTEMLYPTEMLDFTEMLGSTEI